MILLLIPGVIIILITYALTASHFSEKAKNLKKSLTVSRNRIALLEAELSMTKFELKGQREVNKGLREILHTYTYKSTTEQPFSFTSWQNMVNWLLKNMDHAYIIDYLRKYPGMDGKITILINTKHLK